MKKMGKRVLTFFLALAMVLTTAIGTMPVYAAETPELVYACAEWDADTESYVAPADPTLHTGTSFDGVQMSSCSPVFFYFKDSTGTYTRLSIEQLSSSDENVVVLTEGEDCDDLIMVEFCGAGDATIDYTVDEQVYSVEVQCLLPWVGIYSRPEAANSYYINEFTCTEDNNSFYVITRDNCQIIDIELESETASFAEVTVNEDQASATISITDAFPDDTRAHFTVCYLDSDGNEMTQYFSIALYDQRPALKYAYGSHDENGLYFDPNTCFYSELCLRPGETLSVFFCFVQGDEVLEVAVDELTIGDAAILTAEQSAENENATDIQCIDFGKTTISYTADNGKTYSIDVVSELQLVGFYSRPEVSEEYYINEFTITDTDDTFYLVAQDGYTLGNPSLYGSFADFATIELSDDNKYAVITVNEAPPHSGDSYSVIVDTICDQYTNQKMWYDIIVKDGIPGLKCRYSEWTEDGCFENPEYELSTSTHMSLENMDTVYFKYVADDVETALTVEDLRSSDESIIVIREADHDPDAVDIVPVSVGTAYVEYEVNDKTYRYEVVVEYPPVAFYDTPDKTYYLQEYGVTEEENTFYLVAKDGLIIDSYTISSPFDSLVSSQLSDDGKYIKITVTEVRWDSHYMRMEVNVHDEKYPEYTEVNYAGIYVENNHPGNLTYDLSNTLLVDEHILIDQYIYYYDGQNNYFGGKVLDITSSDDFVEIEKIVDGDISSWIIKGAKEGTANLTFTYLDPNDETVEVTFEHSMIITKYRLEVPENWGTPGNYLGVPGEQTILTLKARLVHFDAEKANLVFEDVTDLATFDWKTLDNGLSLNSTFQYKDNVATVTFAEDEADGNYLEYMCEVSYEVDGTNYTVAINEMSMVSEYTYVAKKDIPSQFKYKDKVEITPVPCFVEYDFNTRQKTVKEYTEGISVKFETMYLSFGFEVSNGTEVLEFGEYYEYNPEDKYYLTRGAIADQVDDAVWADFLIQDGEDTLYLDSCSWDLPETDMVYGQVVLEPSEGVTFVTITGEPLETELKTLDDKEGYWYPVGWFLEFGILVDDDYQLMYTSWDSASQGGSIEYDSYYECYYGLVEEGVNTISTFTAKTDDNVVVPGSTSDLIVTIPSEDASDLTGVSLVATPIGETDYVKAAEIIQENVENVEDVLFVDIYMVDEDGEVFTHEGTKTVTIAIPEEWQGKPVSVYYVNTVTGEVEKMEGQMSIDGTAYIFETDHFSYYAVVQEGDAPLEEGEAVRLSGKNRFVTSAKISEGFIDDNSAEAIVIADGITFADALAAAPFAVQEGAPILMVSGKAGTIDDAVIAEINRIDADHNAKIYVIGGTGAVNADVESKLQTMGYAANNIERIYGKNRYLTAIEVAKKVPEASTAYIAFGQNYPDALGAGSAAALNDGVILFTAKEQLTSETKTYLQSKNFDNIVILGGTGVVSAAVESELEAMFPGKVDRIYGKGRVETSVEIAKTYFNTTETVIVSTGWNFADALAGGPLAAYLDAPVILIDGKASTIPDVVTDYIGECGADNVIVLGGAGAVSDVLFEELEALIR